MTEGHLLFIGSSLSDLVSFPNNVEVLSLLELLQEYKMRYVTIAAITTTTITNKQQQHL